MLASDRKGLVWSGAVLIAIVIVLLLIVKALSVVLMTFGAILFAVFLDALTGWAQRYLHLSRTWALTAAVFALLIAGAGFVLLTLPQLTEQATELANQLPQAVERARETLEGLGVPPNLIPQAGDRSVMTQVTAAAASVMDMLFAAVIVAVVGLYLTGDPRRYRDAVARLFPTNAKRRVHSILNDMGTTLRRWLMGRAVLMITNGVLTTLGLWALGVPLAPILGVIAGLLNFVPNLGPIVAAIPALLLALTQGYTTVLGVAILYFLLQNIDGYVFTPIVDRKTVDIPQAINLVFQIVAGVLAGTAGVLLATPFLAVCKVLIEHLHPQDLEPDDSAPERHRPLPAVARQS